MTRTTRTKHSGGVQSESRTRCRGNWQGRPTRHKARIAPQNAAGPCCLRWQPAVRHAIYGKNPISGIDFPPKAIVYEDADGQVWIAYNSADYLYGTIFERHCLTYPEGDVEFYGNVLEHLTDFAVAKDPG